MADIEYFGDDDAHHARDAYAARGRSGQSGPAAQGEAPVRLGTVVNWAGALVSLGLVVGMAVWAFQLTMRDVSGVPVIRALEGPMRVPPADPGGTQAEHQGLAVNRIAEGGEAAPVPDRLVLAPPPVDLEAVSFASSSQAAPTVSVAPAPAPTPSEISAGTQALIDRLIERAEPLPGAPAAEVAAAAAPVVDIVPAAARVIPASVPGVARSLRPEGRPAAIAARALAAPTQVAAARPVAVEEITPDTLAEGTRLVQLGAFDTPDIARAEWERLTGLFPDYFVGRARVIQEASSGGQAFYRLRAHGFEDLAASRRFCAALMAQSAPCIPVTVR